LKKKVFVADEGIAHPDEAHLRWFFNVGTSERLSQAPGRHHPTYGRTDLAARAQFHAAAAFSFSSSSVLLANGLRFYNRLHPAFGARLQRRLPPAVRGRHRRRRRFHLSPQGSKGLCLCGNDSACYMYEAAIFSQDMLLGS
jgi:hypothetical protein